MKRLAFVATLALSAFFLNSNSADAQRGGNGHRGNAQNHRHMNHHGHGHRHGNRHRNNHFHHHGHFHRINHVRIAPPIVVNHFAPVVRRTQPVFFSPGHSHFHNRFHTLVKKGQLPLQVRWDQDRYWILYQNNWMVYDSFVKTHCGGNWDWYLSKHRSKYAFLR